MNIPIWKSGFDNRNATHNSYTDTTADRRCLYDTYSNISSNNINGNVKNYNHFEHNMRTQRLLDVGFTHQNALKMMNAERKQDPIIIWGSHHKTGTYVAQKAFSHTCKRMNWCCIFHVTRDSIHVIEDTIRNEGEHIRVIGHTQWVWDPKEIGITNYRFIHLVRKPYKKILSGYRYHKEGAEAWCLKPLPYDKACDMSYKEVKQGVVPYLRQYERNGRYLRASDTDTNHTIHTTQTTHTTKNSKNTSVVSTTSVGHINTNANSTDKTTTKTLKRSGRKYPPLWLQRDSVQSYCQSVHLCEPCCRREHEVDFPSNRAKNSPISDAWVDPKKVWKNRGTGGRGTRETDGGEGSMGSSDSGNSGETQDVHREMMIAGSEVMVSPTATTNSRKYARHALSVYDFQCRNLGPMTNLSLMETLKMVPPSIGLKVEASIDYYENLRMARIYNATFKDPLR